MSYGVTADEVRLEVGIGTGDISDDDMATIISQAETETDRLLHTTFIPKRIIERKFPEGEPNRIMLRKTPVTRVLNIQIGGTAGTWVDTSKTILDPITGKLTLTANAEKTYFNSVEDKGNIIDYEYGKLEETDTETETTAYVGTGDGITISVGSSTSLSAGDYVKIVSGTEANPEITKILSVGTGTFSANVSWTHPSGSRVIKMQVPEDAKMLTRILAGIMSALHMIGHTYTFATSYSIPEKSVTKGVPYPHFEKVLNTLVSKRDYILKKFRPQSSIY